MHKYLYEFSPLILSMAGRPSSDDIVILRGSNRFSPELALTSSLFLRCDRTPVGQWLRNGTVIAGGSPNLTGVISDGIHQCIGSIPGRPETNFTGESGSNVYLIAPGTYIYIYIIHA